MTETYTLTVNCPQQPGIVHAVTSFLFQQECDIVEHQQFDDVTRGQLFMRTGFRSTKGADAQFLSAVFEEAAVQFGMIFSMTDDGTLGSAGGLLDNGLWLTPSSCIQ